jgi:hypothetical protein
VDGFKEKVFLAVLPAIVSNQQFTDIETSVSLAFTIADEAVKQAANRVREFIEKNEVSE